jgi:hypothetical protein
MELEFDPVVHADLRDPFDVARPRPERQPVQGMNGALWLIHREGAVFPAAEREWSGQPSGGQQNGANQQATSKQQHSHTDGPQPTE